MPFRKGSQAIVSAMSVNPQSKWAPIIMFEPNSTTYLQFLTPLDEITTVLMHQWVIIGQRDDGTPIYEHFISRKDPALDGPNGYDELVERFDLQPKQRSVALAAELDVEVNPSTRRIGNCGLKYRQYTNREGEEVQVPCFGLVIQSPHIFYSHLVNYNDLKPIEKTIFAIKRIGSGTDTSYTFIDTGLEPLDLSEELDNFTQVFNLDEWLTNLASEERMRELISPLPDDWRITKFPSARRSDAAVENKPKKPAPRVTTAASLSPSDRSKRFEELRKRVLQEQ
ncbi:MAG: hypothetical protein QXU32_02450 [Nitrososphaerales archaeon]